MFNVLQIHFHTLKKKNNREILQIGSSAPPDKSIFFQ